MKVYIGPYRNWFGPYQLAELLCFWVKEQPDEYGTLQKPDWVHKFGEWLAHGNVEPEPRPGELRSWDRDRPVTWLYKFLSWIHSKQQRSIQIRIDRWDTWSMDHTLAHIILPMLKQLRETTHGAPYVDDKDVPKELRSTSAKPLTKEEKDMGAVDELHFKRWDWVLNEMIFAFESELDDSWEAQFESGENDLQLLQLEDGMSQLVHGPNHTKKYDRKGREAYEKRIQRGFLLFGKYYSNLWD